MLTALRQSVGSWVAKVFIFLLIASFAVWGVSGAIIGGNSDTVIEVGETTVSANDYVLAYERARFNLSQQFGRLLTREEAQSFGIDANVVNQLVSAAVLDENARTMGLGLSKKSLAGLIGEDEAFQDEEGNFNRDVLRQQLSRLGMNEADYVKNRQAVAIRNQLLEGVSSNTATSQAFLKAYSKFRSEKRVFEYVALAPGLLGKKPEPTPQQITEFYETSKSQFIAPEYREFTLVKLEAEDIIDAASVTPEEIAEEYELRKTQYIVPEKRTIQQLTLSNDNQGKQILERLSNGETFDAILAGLGKSATDIELGEFTKSQLPDANVADAAFALATDKISSVVEGIFGPVLLRVTQVTPQGTQPLSEIEDELRNSLALVKAGDELFDIYDALENERAAGDTMSEAAAKMKLATRSISKIDATGRTPAGDVIADLPQPEQLLREVFDSAVGVETDPISIGASGFIWYEVKEVFAERQKDLEEVKEQVSSSWVELETTKALETIAKDLQSRLTSGEDFATAIGGVLPEGISKTDAEELVKKSAELLREDSSEDLSIAAVRAGFAIGSDKITLATGAKQGEQIVLKVVEIIAGNGNAINLEEVSRLDETIGDDLLNQLIGDLRERETLTINQNAIAATSGFAGSTRSDAHPGHVH